MTTPKKRRLSPSPSPRPDDDADTTTKLTLLLSLHPTLPIDLLLETLVSHSGSVSAATAALTAPFRAPDPSSPPPSKQQRRQQTSLTTFLSTPLTSTRIRPPKKGETRHLYTPSSIAATTPCTLFHGFLPPNTADSLLKELLKTSESFGAPQEFKLFDRVVKSPHTSAFFMRSVSPKNDDPGEGSYYSYQTKRLKSRPYTPSMLAATTLIEEAVNVAIAERYRDIGKKPWGMSKDPWNTNAALVNRYAGGGQSVGWHADELSYIGPMATIASLSLGCEREFRVRRVVSKFANSPTSGEGMVEGGNEEKDTEEGAYSIHLPHNSLLIMHGGMQEGWKHSVHPASKLDLHPVAKDVRMNITYRCYRPNFGPGKTPRCACGVPATLRPVFGDIDENGKRRYYWNCAGGYRSESDGKGCGFFRWGVFDANGEPMWEEMS
jgi:alkylated DNA repair dioxygenase AlkB